MNLTIQSVCHISKDAAAAVADDGDDNGLLVTQTLNISALSLSHNVFISFYFRQSRISSFEWCIFKKKNMLSSGRYKAHKQDVIQWHSVRITFVKTYEIRSFCDNCT